MFGRHNDRPGSRRWIRPAAIAATAVAVASLAIVGTVAAQSRQTFDDVPRGHEHFEAIEWAVENGITQGCDRAGRDFCPDRTLSRAHTVAFLKRYHDKFHSSTSSNPTTTTTTARPSVYTLREFGSDEGSISLPAGRYSVSFTLEHDRTIQEDFNRVRLTVDDTKRSETLLNVNTTTGADPTFSSTATSLTGRYTIDVGDRLGQLAPGRIYFAVVLTPSGSPSRAPWAEWEIVVSER